MATFKTGDLVWAKMKGFPAWPGKLIDPKNDKKTEKRPKNKHFVFFYGSENYAWIPEEQIWSYVTHKDKFLLTNRIPRGFKEAVESIEEAFKNLPPSQSPAKCSELPSIDDELAVIQQGNPNAHKDNTSKPFSKKGKREEQAKDKSGVASSEKKGKDSPKVSPKMTKRRSSSQGTPGSLQMKKPRLHGKSPLSSQSRRSGEGLTNSTRVISVKPTVNHEKAASSTLPTSVSPTSTTTPKKSLVDGCDGWTTSFPSFKKDSPLFEHSYDRMLEPSMVEPILSKSIIPTPLKIGFLGLGIMGSGMVSNLLKSGHEVTVWNRTPSKCREFVKDGALKGNSPAEVVQQCDITLSSVADPTALKDLVFGNCGVLQGISQGKAYVDLSTVDVETISDVHEAVTARGGRFLEAPVIGSKQPSSTGDLIILAAGDKSLYEDCYSCFEAMGKKTFYLGEIGSAARMKLVLNLFMGTVLAGLAESLALAEKVGLDQEEVLQILDISPAACSLVKTKGHAIARREFDDVSTTLRSTLKDCQLINNMADSVDQPLHTAAAVTELFKKAKAKGYGEHDIAAVYRAADL